MYYNNRITIFLPKALSVVISFVLENSYSGTKDNMLLFLTCFTKFDEKNPFLYKILYLQSDGLSYIVFYSSKDGFFQNIYTSANTCLFLLIYLLCSFISNSGVARGTEITDSIRTLWRKWNIIGLQNNFVLPAQSN